MLRNRVDVARTKNFSFPFCKRYDEDFCFIPSWGGLLWSRALMLCLSMILDVRNVVRKTDIAKFLVEVSLYNAYTGQNECFGICQTFRDFNFFSFAHSRYSTVNASLKTQNNIPDSPPLYKGLQWLYIRLSWRTTFSIPNFSFFSKLQRGIHLESLSLATLNSRGCLSPSDLASSIHNEDLCSTFPIVSIALRMLMSLIISNCSGVPWYYISQQDRWGLFSTGVS